LRHPSPMRLTSPVPFLCFPLLLMTFGCGKPRFDYEVEPTFRTGAYLTVAPDPRKDRILIREGMRPLNSDLHLKATLTELETRHYRMAPAPQADLWVTAYLLIPGRPEGASGGKLKGSHSDGSGGGRHGGGHGGSGGGHPSASGQAEGGQGKFTVIVVLGVPQHSCNGGPSVGDSRKRSFQGGSPHSLSTRCSSANRQPSFHVQFKSPVPVDVLG
jgi:hypothetical protein